MLKIKFIFMFIKALIWIAIIGVGVSYLSRSIGGDSIAYMSLDSFLNAIGACEDGVCDAGVVRGCFLCVPIEQLFTVIGTAAYAFWDAIIRYVWILLSLGFAIFLFNEAWQYIKRQNDEAAKLGPKEAKSEDIWKGFIDPVWKQAVRVLFVGVLLGAVGMGGSDMIRIVADVIITPVMFIGSSLAMAASGINTVAVCGTGDLTGQILGPALQPFMCVVGNINTIVLAGASGGFALMNYSWMGMGGLWTWIAGLGLVLMFLFVGFSVFFKILTVIFQLVFLIIFLPLFVAIWAYENKWQMLSGAMSNAIGMLAKCAVRVIAITLQILILYAMVDFVAREYFPGPYESGFTVLLPAGIMGNEMVARDARGQSIIEVFQRCEIAAKQNPDGLVDRNLFRACFERERVQIERYHPGAFDFMSNGFRFILMFLGIFLVYHYAIAKRVDALFDKSTGDSSGNFSSDTNDEFAYGKYVRDFTSKAWKVPLAVTKKAEGRFAPGKK